MSGFGSTGKKQFISVLFLMGFIAGILYVAHAGSSFWQTGGLDEHTLRAFKESSVDKGALFSFVFMKRAEIFFLLILFSTTYLGRVICIGQTVWFGVITGAYLGELSARYGVRGTGLALAGLFPQYLVYLPVFGLLLARCDTIYRYIYIQKSAGQGLSRSAVKVIFAKNLLAFMLLFGALAVGCMLESYINPSIFKNAIGNL